MQNIYFFICNFSNTLSYLIFRAWNILLWLTFGESYDSLLYKPLGIILSIVPFFIFISILLYLLMQYHYRKSNLPKAKTFIILEIILIMISSFMLIASLVSI